MKSQTDTKFYLYTIARRDIPLAQQAIQASHAAIEYAFEHGRSPDHHPSIVNLTVKNKAALETLKIKLHSLGIKTAEFQEPYKEWGLTSIACIIGESERHVLKNLPLWKLPTQEIAK